MVTAHQPVSSISRLESFARSHGLSDSLAYSFSVYVRAVGGSDETDEQTLSTLLELFQAKFCEGQK